MFRKVARFMKMVVRTNLPIKVRRVLLKYDGLCIDRKYFFQIKINKSLNENHAIDVLIHEMAHIDSWGKDRNVHGKNWGISYSKLYRLYEKQFLD